MEKTEHEFHCLGTMNLKNTLRYYSQLLDRSMSEILEKLAEGEGIRSARDVSEILPQENPLAERFLGRDSNPR